MSLSNNIKQSIENIKKDYLIKATTWTFSPKMLFRTSQRTVLVKTLNWAAKKSKMRLLTKLWRKCEKTLNWGKLSSIGINKALKRLISLILLKFRRFKTFLRDWDLMKMVWLRISSKFMKTSTACHSWKRPHPMIGLEMICKQESSPPSFRCLMNSIVHAWFKMNHYWRKICKNSGKFSLNIHKPHKGSPTTCTHGSKGFMAL